jgi:proteasome accessory factor B
VRRSTRAGPRPADTVVADPVERVTNLLALLLSARRPLTLQQIAHDLDGQYPESESARRTAFERDKALLRATGVPIDQVVLGGDQAGQTAYSVDPHRYRLEDLGLEDDERRAVQLAVAMIATGTPWGQEALWKVAPGEILPTRGPAAVVPSLAALPALFEACRDRRSIRFSYRGTTRELEPYSLVARGGFWYLVGHDLTRGEMRTFRVDRIDGEIVASERDAFVRPDGFDVRSVMPAGGRALAEGSDAIRTATVLVDARRSTVVEHDLGTESVQQRRADGSIVVTVPWTDDYSFRGWVLGNAEHAEVLGPAEARSLVVAWLEAMVGVGA